MAALPSIDEDQPSSKRLKPTGALPEAGTTPLWHPAQLAPDESAMRSTVLAGPQLRPNESAMRSTLPPSDFVTCMPNLPEPPLSPATPRTFNGHAMAIDNLIHPSEVSFETSSNPLAQGSGFTPINYNYTTCRPFKAPLNSTSYAIQTGHWMIDMDIDMNQIDSREVSRNGVRVLQVDDSLMVDKDDGRMWHLGNNTKESFSGTFIYDDPDDIGDSAKQFITKLAEEKARSARMALTVPILERVRMLVNEGCLLSVERVSFVEDGDPIICDRPGCHDQAALPADRYYMAAGTEYTFCLRCFEMLWGGKYTEGMAVADPLRRDSGVVLPTVPFDGLSDRREPARRSQRIKASTNTGQNNAAEHVPQPQPMSELFHSIVGTPGGGNQSSSPMHTPQRNFPTEVGSHIESMQEESPNSVDSHGEWIDPPTETQHIAHLLKSGYSLSGADKAAVALWQEVSKQQLQWNRHLWKVKATRAYYAGECEEDMGLYVEPLGLGEYVDLEQFEEWKSKTGLSKKECNGRELTWVLREAALRKKA